MVSRAEALAELARRGVQLPQEAPKLTEDQGKAQTYANLMSQAERSYQRAVGDGYDPGSTRNTFASFLEGLPFGGLGGAGAVVRDDVSDRARQAEIMWSDAQLKAMSGAASPEPEVQRNVRAYFPRPGETFGLIEPQKRASRAIAYSAAKTRAGPAGKDVAPYPQQLPDAARNRFETLFKAGQIDTKQPHGTRANPYVARDEATANNLPPGSYVVMPDGRLGVIE